MKEFFKWNNHKTKYEMESENVYFDPESIYYNHKIKQLIPCSGYIAVWGDDSPEFLFTREILAWGIVTAYEINGSEVIHYDEVKGFYLDPEFSQLMPVNYADDFNFIDIIKEKDFLSEKYNLIKRAKDLEKLHADIVTKNQEKK